MHYSSLLGVKSSQFLDSQGCKDVELGYLQSGIRWQRVTGYNCLMEVEDLEDLEAVRLMPL